MYVFLTCAVACKFDMSRKVVRPTPPKARLMFRNSSDLRTFRRKECHGHDWLGTCVLAHLLARGVDVAGGQGEGLLVRRPPGEVGPLDDVDTPVHGGGLGREPHKGIELPLRKPQGEDLQRQSFTCFKFEEFLDRCHLDVRDGLSADEVAFEFKAYPLGTPCGTEEVPREHRAKFRSPQI